MKKEVDIIILPHFINNYDYLRSISADKLKINSEEITAVKILRRSIDARSRNPIYRVRALVFISEPPEELQKRIVFRNVSGNKKAVVIGFGPAGMFASLRLIELGIKPMILERGKDVQTRRRDLKAIQQKGKVNPDSNYCFGEGGAGTYSDGKLYTRSTKRGSVERILNLLVQHGAPQEILIDAHPHVGSNLLPKVVENIRHTILNHDGEIQFNSRVTGLIIEKKKIKGVIVNNNQEILGDAVLLGTGHSARDIYFLLHKSGIMIEAKPFAVGVRIEHPQKIIDEIQYHSKERHPNLPPSSYNLACQIDEHGVYSFCMCPGGIIIPASTAPGELVLNGMSVSKRNSLFANSGLVVTVNEKDWSDYKKHGVFAGLEFQKEVESNAFEAGGRTQRAPAQRVTDFVKGITSSSATGALHQAVLKNN